MKKNIDTADAWVGAPALSTPLAMQSVFWRSRYLRKSGFIHYLPFAFWLTETCQPTTIAEIGMQDAQCYFSFCQAVDKLNIPARCLGFGAWDSVPPDIAEHNDQYYQEFSRIESRSSKVALRRLSANRPDLLAVDMAAELGDGAVLVDLCETGMSERGCVLLYGLDAAYEDPQKHKILKALSSRHKTIIFEDNVGLALVLIGPEQNDRLLQLASIKPGSREFHEVQTVFNRLGAGHYHEWLSREKTEAAEAAEASAASLDKELTRKSRELEELTEAYAERDQAASEAQIALFDLEQVLARLESESLGKTKTLAVTLESQTAELSDLRTRLDQRKSRNSDLGDELARAGGERDAAQAALAAHQETQAALKDQYAVGQIALERARKERDDVAAVRAQDKTEFHQAQALAEDAVRKLEEGTARARADHEDIAARLAEAEKACLESGAGEDALEAALEKQTLILARKSIHAAARDQEVKDKERVLNRCRALLSGQGMVGSDLVAALEKEAVRLNFEQDRQAQEIVLLTRALEVARDHAIALEGETRAAGIAVAQAQDVRFRETHLLTQQLQALGAEQEKMAQAAEQEGEKLKSLHLGLFEEHSALSTRHGVQAHRADKDKAAAVRAAARSEREKRFKETGVLSAEIERMAGMHEAQMKEAGARAQILIRLREWQVAALTQTSRLPRLRADGGLKKQVQIVTDAPQFDAAWYVSKYPDLAGYPKSAAQHFVQFGVFEGRDPGPTFSTINYYLTHPEALENRVNPVVHAVQA